MLSRPSEAMFGTRPSAKRISSARTRTRLAVVLEGDFLPVANAAGIQELGAGVKVDAFAAEDLLQFGGGIVIELVQDVGAALDQSHADAEPGEELRQLNRHRAAAQHDERFGQPAQAKGRVAGQVAQRHQAAGSGEGATTEPVAMTKCAAVSFSPVLSSSVCGSAKRARARRNLNLPLASCCRR